MVKASKSTSSVMAGPLPVEKKTRGKQPVVVALQVQKLQNLTVALITDVVTMAPIELCIKAVVPFVVRFKLALLIVVATAIFAPSLPISTGG